MFSNPIFRPELFAKGDFYITKAGDTWNSIANDFYDNPSLWWAICSANGIEDPTEDPEPGQMLFIPDIADVLEVIEQ